MTFDVSSFAVGWNVYRDFSDKGRLKVNCYIGKHVTPVGGIIKNDLLIWSITNVGKRSIVVMHIGGSLQKDDFIIDTKTDLPHKLESGEYITEYIHDLQIFNEDVKKLFVIDTIGNKYKTSNKSLRKIKKSANSILKKTHNQPLKPTADVGEQNW